MVISDNQDGKMEDVVEEEPTRQSSRRGGIQAKENIQKKVKFSDVAMRDVG